MLAWLRSLRKWWRVVLIVAPTIGIAAGCEGTTGPKNGGPIHINNDWAVPSYLSPTWSPDGSWLAVDHRPLDSIYVDNKGLHHYVFDDSLAGLWMIRAEGVGKRRVLPYMVDDPSWAHNGRSIAYGIGDDIWKIAASDSEVDLSSAERLTFEANFGEPSWNPSCTKLVFTKFRGPTAGVYLLGAGGGAPQWIGQPRWRSPDWSPDGTRLVFIGNVGSSYGIACSDTLGREARILTISPVGPTSPKWSPDGTRIAFLAQSPSTHVTHLWVMDSSGTGIQQASQDPVGQGFAWAPDGQRIAYVRRDPFDHSYTNGQMWIVDLRTGGLTQLTYYVKPVP